MKIIVSAFVALLLGSALASSEAEARCWWNGYNHCRYSGWHHGYGYYHHGYYRNGYWYR
jgi:hypothetical protein